MSRPVPASLTAAALPQLAHVWRADQLSQELAPTLGTGDAGLDAQLPGGGWPQGALIELLQDQAGRHDWRLLLPALAAWVRHHRGPVVLVGAPHAPFGPSLTAQGLPGERLLWVDSAAPAARLWACEQALRCADVAAVLSWLPQARASQLRRLQMTAQEHGKPLFVFRPATARHESSPAPLRLLLGGADEMVVQILKRRGPPSAVPLVLPAQPPRLAALLAASRRSREAAPALQPPVPAATVIPLRRTHALDRIASPLG